MVLLVANLFHPVYDLALPLLLNGDVGHGRGQRRSMPVLLTWRKRHDIPRPDVLDGAAPTLHSSDACCDDQGLPERVGVPCRARARREVDARCSEPATPLKGLRSRRCTPTR